MLEAKIINLAITDRGFALILKPNDNDKVVPIFIATMEAQSIMIGFLGFEQPRPLSHDIFKDILIKCSIELKYIVITEIHDDTFYAKIIIESKDETIKIDSRPSDAIALALRMKSPIFIEEDVINTAGIIIDENDNIDLTKTVPFNYKNFDFEVTKDSIHVKKEVLPEVNNTRSNEDISEKDILIKMLKDAIKEERYEDAARYRDQLEGM